jgi:hypothetical protein
MLPSLLLAGLLFAAEASPQATCSLSVTSPSSSWNGSCGKLIEGTDAHVEIHASSTIASGKWKRDQKPESVWAGTLTTSEYPQTAVEIEIYDGARGVMRTVFGWYPVTHFSRASDAMRFDVDPSSAIAPSSVDREIIERASKILFQVSAWNRSDNRKCPEDATTWSIYCAMEKATIEVAGAFHHRRPALEIIRQIVDERTKNRPYEHRLMDYNNDPTTQLSDVQSLFFEALKRVRASDRKT